MKTLFSFLSLFVPILCVAQKADSIFVRQDGTNLWHARYRVGTERSVFAVAKKFGVPASKLADVNGLSYAESLSAGRLIKIPLTLANWYNYTPPASAQVAPLYYRGTEEEDWKDLGARLGVSKRQLQDWNKRIDEPEAGQVFAVGWISLGVAGGSDVATDSRPMPQPLPKSWPDTTIIIEKAPTPPVLSPMEQAFQDQTAGGTMVTTEKGAAAFFPAGGGTIKGVHYAFHNSAPRGSVARVHNPGTGRTVYVKVLGPMPNTKQYAGAIIGVSGAAKAQLGVRGDARAWCEVSYAGY